VCARAHTKTHTVVIKEHGACSEINEFDVVKHAVADSLLAYNRLKK
jgi:hypothetical protein